MKEVHITEFVYENGEIVLPLGSGKNILRVQLVTSSSDGKGGFRIRYAQNDVLDVLLPYCYRRVNDEQTYTLGKPICATHFFIKPENTTAQIEEVIIFEEEECGAATYPHVFDTDLGALYRLSTVTVNSDAEGELFYILFTSEDGQNFSYLAEKPGGVPSTAGDVFAAESREAKFIRILITYHSADPYVNTPTFTYTGERLDKAAPAAFPIDIPDFEETPYALPIREDETIDALYGIVERRLGTEYREWFSFGLLPGEKYNFFTISDKEGKIHIEGNCGVSLAVGLNHYLKYYCKVHISQVGDQIKMPPSPVRVGKMIRKETKAQMRYAYNYCTHSYTMAFWGEEEWQREIDLLALSGVNLVLDITGMEEVWRRFLGEIGYTHDAIKEFLSGPAYYAWQYIGNQAGQGGPLHDSWFASRVALARKNRRMMRALGMQVTLEGYNGVVPSDILLYDKDASIVHQGAWCSFMRPAMLRPDSDSFSVYAKRFYRIQKAVFGDAGYYQIGAFHEGGHRGNMSDRVVIDKLLGEMLTFNKDAVGIMTSWQGNPTSEMLAGIGEDRRNHAMIMDLYADKTPHYKDGGEGKISYGYRPEFDQTPWVYCLLNNFGGRLGLHGHLDLMAKEIPTVLNATSHCLGVGMVPEASENNPVLYDFLFDVIWQDNADEKLPEIELCDWLHAYAERRYGKKSDVAEAVWDILVKTVYRAECNMKGQGAPEAVTNARPAFKITAASAWGNAVIDYDKNRFREAYDLLLSLYDEMKDSDGYRYDLASLALQVLANEAQDIHTKMVTAYRDSDKSTFERESARFLSVITEMDAAADSSPYLRLDRWTGMAAKLAEGTDDFTKKIFAYNARALVTTWGSYYPSEVGMLHDYSNRTWSGLLGGLYYDRWKTWIEERKKELDGKPSEDIDFFRLEWLWTWGRHT